MNEYTVERILRNAIKTQTPTPQDLVLQSIMESCNLSSTDLARAITTKANILPREMIDDLPNRVRAITYDDVSRGKPEGTHRGGIFRLPWKR